MGLFSKLFSRENEPADKLQQGSETKASPDGKEQPTQSETSAVEQNEQNEQSESRPRTPAVKAEPPPPRPSNQQALEEAPTTRFTTQSLTNETSPSRETSVAEAAAAIAAQPPAPPKREEGRAAAAPPPLAGAKSNAGAARAPAAAAPAVAKTVPLLKQSASRAEPPKVAEPAKKRAAAAPQPAPAPAAAAAQKAAPPARGATDEPARPKRGPRHTPRVFGAPAMPNSPESAAAAPAPKEAIVQNTPGPANPKGADLPLAAEVDAAVDQLLDATAAATRSNASDHAADARAVAETFAAMVKVNAHPLRDFMFHVSVGRTPRQWAAACRPLLRPLLDASQQIGAAELADALSGFDRVLERASHEASACIGDATTTALEQAYARLHAQMPEAFTPLAQTDGRRLVLLESLLLQVPALHRRVLDKFYAAGVASLPQLSQARPDELAAVAGIEPQLAQAVVEHVRKFERERSRVDPAALRSHFFERLRSAVRRLEQLQAEFESAEQDESSARKRAARRSREATVLEIELLCAELGDLDLLEELKRCAVRSKIRRVESYLERLPASA